MLDVADWKAAYDLGSGTGEIEIMIRENPLKPPVSAGRLGPLDAASYAAALATLASGRKVGWDSGRRRLETA